MENAWLQLSSQCLYSCLLYTDAKNKIHRTIVLPAVLDVKLGLGRRMFTGV
jgi:hypothetical protein